MVNYDYMRPIKAEHFKRCYDNLQQKELNVYTYDNATILPVKQIDGVNVHWGNGGLIDEHGKYVEQSAILDEVTGDRMNFAYEFDEYDYVDEEVVYGGFFIDHWGHFLVDVIGRLWYFLQQEGKSYKYVFSIRNGEECKIEKNFREFFELLGIWKNLIFINKPTKYRRVILPELGYRRSNYYSQEYKDIFDEVCKNVCIDKSWKKYSKIFLTRSSFKKSNDIGTDMIDSVFRNNGFQVLAPEKLRLSHMIYLIRNAEICATFPGSTHHNFLFAEENKKIVILEKTPMINHFLIDINRLKNFDITYIDAYLFISPTVSGRGPYLYFYRGMLEKYIEDNKMKPCDKCYFKESYLKKCMKQYFRMRYRLERFRWILTKDNLIALDCMHEAYRDTWKYVGDYIVGWKICFLFQLSENFRIRYRTHCLKIQSKWKKIFHN